jgi:hypothetical protein
MSTLTCDVSDCENRAIASALPTHGETEHSALRCRDCLLYDLNRHHFAEWKRAIQRDTDYLAGPEENENGN